MSRSRVIAPASAAAGAALATGCDGDLAIRPPGDLPAR